MFFAITGALSIWRLKTVTEKLSWFKFTLFFPWKVVPNRLWKLWCVLFSSSFAVVLQFINNWRFRQYWLISKWPLLWYKTIVCIIISPITLFWGKLRQRQQLPMRAQIAVEVCFTFPQVSRILMVDERDSILFKKIPYANDFLSTFFGHVFCLGLLGQKNIHVTEIDPLRSDRLI